ncbi:MAG TPA: protein kinase [Thermoanaerobaculia bacterium]|nr:protein kinase [Thermoanaerobaculia bacterium]
MTLSPGSRLGPYEIVSPLGAGGMGEVYRARDTRLERTVAIKVLASHLSVSPEVRQRFEREAKTISQLSHPHICALYDVGREGETEYLVMEFLEGDTLADRLARGPLPLEQALRYGVEIADALDKAHRQGIVHRDLKPGNVMLTRSGVKLLDFGLAKAVAPGGGAEDLTALPTQANLTREGTILGTFQYMAPEQLEGKDADARTDIFAFGALLHEMATGRKAFSGSSQATLIGSILHTEPESISAMQPAAPSALDRIVKTCLAKDPEERWQSAADVKRELRWITEGSQAGIPQPVVSRRRNREWLPWALTAVSVLVAAGAVARFGLRTAPPPAAMRYSIVVPDKSAVRAVAVSPDGTRMVFVARDSTGRNLLWIRSRDSLAVQALPGTDNPSFPFWSPDNRSIGFFADGKLKRIEAAGGPPQTLCDAPLNRGGAWNRDGVILFAPASDSELYRVSSSGGRPTPLTRLDPSRGETSHRWPYFLPDGHRFLYLVASFARTGEQERMGVYVRSLDSNEEKLLVRANSSMAYAPPGYLLFYRERNLMASPFDLKGLRITGDPLPVAEEIQHYPQTYSAQFSVSQNGLLVYQPVSSSGVSQLAWFDRNGSETGHLGPPANQSNPRISPDGKRVAVDIVDPQTGNNDIWIYDAAGGIPTRFTSNPAFDNQPIWSPDGSRIFFMSLRSKHPDLYLKIASGAADEELILESEAAKYPTDWSPDGRFLLFRSLDPGTNFELWTMGVGGDRKPTPFLKASFGVSHGQFSPDGRWVAYNSNESGKWEIYVSSFPGPGGTWRVSMAGGSEPRWRRDGKELFYLAPDGKLMAVAVKEGPTFDADAVTPLFSTRLRQHVSSGDLFTYDVAADGQRFLLNTDVGEVTSSPLTVVLNWTADLKSK